MTALLELKNITAAYGASPVIRGVDVVVADGGITALLGSNGAGKTTLLRAICNMRVENIRRECFLRTGVSMACRQRKSPGWA